MKFQFEKLKYTCHVKMFPYTAEFSEEDFVSCGGPGEEASEGDSP